MTYKLLTFTLFFIVILNIGFAQTAKIDSLERILASHSQTDTVKIKLLNDIAYKSKYIDVDKTLKYSIISDSLSNIIGYELGKANSYINIGIHYYLKADYKQALEYFDRAIIIGRQIKDKSIIATATANSGVIYMFQGNYAKALECYNEKLETDIESNDSIGLSKTYNNIGIIYYYKGDYPRSLEYYQKALKISEKYSSKAQVNFAYDNIGMVYKRQGYPEKALEYFQKAYKLNEEVGNKNATAASCLNIGELYASNGEHKKSLEYFEKSKSIGEEINDSRLLSICYGSMAKIFLVKNDYENALEYNKKALSLAKEMGLNNYITVSYAGLCKVHLNQKEYSLALKYGEEAYKTAIELGGMEEIKDASQVLAEVYSLIGNYEKAYRYHVEYKNQSDKLYNESNIKEVTNLENQYEFNKEKESIAAKQAQKDAVQAAEMKRQKQLRNAFIAGALVFLILMIIILRNLIQKRRANYILAEQKEEIQAQSEELQATNDKLMELDQFKEGMTGMIVHDLKNPLNSIINLSEDIKAKQSGKQMLNMVMNILDVSKYEQSKMLIDKVDCSLLEISLNAINEVMFLVEQKNLSISNKISTETSIKGDKEIIERVFVNLLTNAIKYSPNNGEIELIASENDLAFVEIKVLDTGEGIPSDKLGAVFEKFGQITAKKSGNIRSTGLGLSFCKMAVEAHGGSIIVESELKKGTTFTFTIEASDTVIELESKKKDSLDYKSEILLSDSDIEILKPYLYKLQKLLVYESSQIKAILKDIDQYNSDGLQEWVVNLKKSLFAMNEERYNELINMC